jgi:hypothetical protein
MMENHISIIYVRGERTFFMNLIRNGNATVFFKAEKYRETVVGGFL